MERKRTKKTKEMIKTRQFNMLMSAMRGTNSVDKLNRFDKKFHEDEEEEEQEV